MIDEVVALELRLLDPAVRARRDEVERLLHADFAEIGASGRLWDRASIVEALAEDPGAASEASDVVAQPVGDGVVLVTYVARRGGDASRRSSLWVQTDDGWRVRFHQGTPCA